MKPTLENAAPIRHVQLVKEAANWLRGSMGCSVVAAELVCAASREIPDAIGFKHNGLSILVECKTNRADFLVDASKNHRNGHGMGRERWFYAPAGVIDPATVPPGWGLLERENHGTRYICRQTKKPEMRDLSKELAINERSFLVSLAYRALEACALVKPLTISEQEPA